MLHSKFTPLLTALDSINLLISHAIEKDSYPQNVSPVYLRDAMRQYPLAMGKRMRPALVLWICGLLGKDPLDAVHGAVCAELYHNWTLVHDDIIDKDLTRRGAPTVHAGIAQHAIENGLPEKKAQELGLSTAILAGDLIQGWAIDRLCRQIESGTAPNVILSFVKLMQTQLHRDLISGEALDVDFSYQDFRSITPDAIIKMFSGKTSALLSFCANLAVGIAKNDDHLPDPDRDAMTQFSEALGIAFQLQDDILGVYGDEKTLGKPVGSDLIAQKATFLIADAFAHLPPEKSDELYALTGHVISENSCEHARALITLSGAKQRTLSLAESYIKKAKEILFSYPANEYRTLLLLLCDFAIEREK